MSIKNKTYLIFFILFFLLFVNKIQAQITSLEKDRLIQKAKNKVLDYEQWLNTVGLERNKKWYKEDIESAITLDFESDSVPVFNNLNFNNQKTIPVKNYLNSVKNYYTQGVVFNHSFESVQDPCSITNSEYTYFSVKLTYTQTISGFNYSFDKYQAKPDTIDIYVKFIVRRLGPLETDLDKIYKITKHKVTDCGDSQKKINNTIENKNLVLAKIPQGNETSILEAYAKTLVSDYANILNAVNNEKLNTRGVVKDYFYNDTTALYNDIVQNSDRVQFFQPQDYIEQIKKYWKDDGIKFNYEIQNDDVKITQGLGHISAEVTVKRRVETENFKEKRHKFNDRIRVIVWFPVDEGGNVILERGSAKVHRIEEKKYLSEEIKEKLNTYYWQAGAQINIMNYFGELNRFETTTGTAPRFTSPSFGVHISKKIKRQLYLSLSYIWGMLEGDDFVSADPMDVRHRFRYMRNTHFRNNIHEVSLTAKYELFRASASKYRTRIYRRRAFMNVYILAGLGILKHNPEARTPSNLGGEWVSLRDLGTEGQGLPGYRKKYSLWQPAIPIGIGVKMKLTDNIDLVLEMGGRLLFTDFLDDVSGNYPELEKLSPLARAMSYRVEEAIAVTTGESREAGITRFIEETGLGPITFIDSNGNPQTVINGYGRPIEIRGNPKTNDFYIVTGIHINYIFGKR